jgi:hypothetical protein
MKVAQVLTAEGGGQKENPMGEKHYVYSARTTDAGLALINKARGDRGWDEFVNQAVAEHYGLDLNVMALPPSKFLEEQRAKRDAKAKAKKAADKKSSRKVEKHASRKAARQQAEAVA